jgi:hypothetical protein
MIVMMMDDDDLWVAKKEWNDSKDNVALFFFGALYFILLLSTDRHSTSNIILDHNPTKSSNGTLKDSYLGLLNCVLEHVTGRDTRPTNIKKPFNTCCG